MKRLILFTTTIFTIVLFESFTTQRSSYTNVEIKSGSGFCEGWDDGYQDALKGCFKVGITPICPIPPIGRNSYKDGYGLGYAKALQKCDN